MDYFRADTRRSTDHDQGRQGELEQADRRDRRALHHRHGQAQAGHTIHGRPARGCQGYNITYCFDKIASSLKQHLRKKLQHI